MTCDPHWTAYIGALLVPTVALLGLLIAYRQWRTAQSKLKLELFEKRLAIYNAATAFVSSVMTSGKATDEELYAKGVNLQCLSAELEGVPVSEERSNNVHEQRNIKLWLKDQYRILDEKFAKYLSISH